MLLTGPPIGRPTRRVTVPVGSVASMPTPAADRQFGGLVDRRLAARVTVTRRYLVIAVAVGLVGTACVVAQAVLLATIIERSVLHGVLARVGDAAAASGSSWRSSSGPRAMWVGEAAAQRCGATVTSVLRGQLLRHALDLGPVWLAGERAGELSLAATRGTAALDVYFGRYLPQAILAGLAPIGILAWVAWTDWVSLLVLLGVVALVPVTMILFGRRAAAETQRQWRRLSSLSARFLELIRGLPTLRAFGRAAQGRREVAAATEGLRQTTMATLRVAFLSALAMEFLAGIGTGLVAMVLGLRLLGGTVSLDHRPRRPPRLSGGLPPAPASRGGVPRQRRRPGRRRAHPRPPRPAGRVSGKQRRGSSGSGPAAATGTRPRPRRPVRPTSRGGGRRSPADRSRSAWTASASRSRVGRDRRSTGST